MRGGGAVLIGSFPAKPPPPLAQCVELCSQGGRLAGGDSFGRYGIGQRDPELVDAAPIFGCLIEAPVRDVQPMSQIGNDLVFVGDPFP